VAGKTSRSPLSLLFFLYARVFTFSCDSDPFPFQETFWPTRSSRFTVLPFCENRHTFRHFELSITQVLSPVFFLIPRPFLASPHCVVTLIFSFPTCDPLVSALVHHVSPLFGVPFLDLCTSTELPFSPRGAVASHA